MEAGGVKARLKEKTVALDEKTSKMLKMLSEAQKMVKVEVPKESWREFGIGDKM